MTPAAPSKFLRAYDDLRARIITMRLRPGERLAEREFCAELAISRTPFREAVQRLAKEGLVTVVPSDATFVNPIIMRQVVAGHFLRANLEVPATALAAERMTPDHRPAFTDLLARMEDAAHARDADLSFALDKAFHRRIFVVAGLESAWHVVHDATGQLDRLRRWVFQGQNDHFGETLAEHRTIAGAIARNDAAAARALMARHLDDTVEVPPQIMSEDPGMIISEPDDLAMFHAILRMQRG